MPPLEATASEVQRAVQEFQQIEQRVKERMNNAALSAGAQGSSSALQRVAAIYGIRLSQDPNQRSRK